MVQSWVEVKELKLNSSLLAMLNLLEAVCLLEVLEVLCLLVALPVFEVPTTSIK